MGSKGVPSGILKEVALMNVMVQQWEGFDDLQSAIIRARTLIIIKHVLLS